MANLIWSLDFKDEPDYDSIEMCLALLNSRCDPHSNLDWNTPNNKKGVLEGEKIIIQESVIDDLPSIHQSGPSRVLQRVPIV